MKDGTIVATMTDGRTACKTNYPDAWDYNKLVSSGVNFITQFQDGTIVALRTDGRTACKTNYSDAWDFNKFVTTNLSFITQLQ